MADLICPPPWGQKPPCPCRPVRYGFGLVAMCAYSAAFSTVFLGKPFGAVIGPVLRGEASIYDWPIIWMSCAVMGALCFGAGVGRIAGEGHAFKFGSFLWSVGVVALAAWRLAHWPDCVAIGQPGLFGTPITLFDWHFLRMLFVGWLAANAANIALNLGEVFGWRLPRFARRDRAAVQAVPSGFLRGRRVTVATIEEIEGDGFEAESLARHLGANTPADVLRAVEHGGDVPLIDLVPSRDGSFIPFDLPQGKAVPVKRRR